MKILGCAANNSRHSINRALIECAGLRLQTDSLPSANIDVVDLNDDEMPFHSIDREQDGGIPAPAQAFYDKIASADAVLVSCADHNGFVTAAWQTIFDWMSRIAVPARSPSNC